MSLIAELKQRKIVQWTVAYAAAAFALLQGIDIVGEKFGWPDSITRILIIASCVGFFITLLLAWYHGERGAQKVSATELVLLALLLAIGGGLIWQYADSHRPVSVEVDAKLASEGATNTNPSPDGENLAAEAGAIPAKSIAVLPFESLSADKDNEFFAIGMQDMILTRLAEIGDLKVISRTSTLEYGSRPTNLKLVARQLGVATVLESSVQRVGNEVLINVQLIDARTDAHLWAANYQRKLDNVFEVEAEVARKVAEALHASLTEAETAAIARAATNNPQAYELYLKGIYEGGQFSNGSGEPAHLMLAESYYRQAIDKDPNFSLAHSKLAMTIGSVWANGIKDSPERRDEAMEHARKAVALQPDSSWGHLTVGMLLRLEDNDNTQAMAELQMAQSLAPNDAAPAFLIAILMVGDGRWAEAQLAIATAVKLSPRSLNIREWAILIAVYNGDYLLAQRFIDKFMLDFPRHPRGQALAAQLFLLQGNPAAALALPADQPDTARAVIIAEAYFLSRDYLGMRKAAAKAPAAARDADAGQRQLDEGVAAKFSGDDTAAEAALKLAATAIQQAMAALPSDVLLAGRLVSVRMWQDDRDGAMQALEHTRQLVATDFNRANGILSTGLQEAEILAHFGESEVAVSQLRLLLDSPGFSGLYSPAMMHLDPTWDPIRETPQFEALLRDYPADVVTKSRGGAP